MMKMSKLWDIVQRFKGSCKRHGWQASESEDWVEADGDYHNFLWARDVHVSSFKRIASNKKCIVREGLSYRVVEAAYTAWLFSQKPSEDLLKTVLENPDFSSKIALYDLTPALEGKNVCVKLNFTDSPVFQEFESFLKDELKVKVKNLSPISGSGVSSDHYTVVELA